MFYSCFILICIFRLPGPGRQFVFTGPGPQFVFTGSGPQFVFNGPVPQFVFTGPGPKFLFTGPGPKFLFTGPGQPRAWACIHQHCPHIANSGSSNISNSSKILGLDNTNINMPILVN